MRHTVLVTDRVSAKGLVPLLEDQRIVVEQVDDSSSDAFDRVLIGAHGLVVRSATKVSGVIMEKAPDLKVIGRAGTGLDNVDLAEATKRGIAVFNAAGANTIATAEMTMALMLATVRRVAEADRSVRAGEWDRARFRGVELRGRVLGVVGAGRIGAEVARRCKAFGMEVIACDPLLTPERAAELEVREVSLDEILAQADVITLHIPLTEETAGLIDWQALRAMKDDAYLINASRGAVIDEEALATALHQGWIAGAALDVYQHEPLPEDSPLRDAPHLVLSPHLGGSTDEAQIGVAHEVALSVRAALVDGDVSGAVNAADIQFGFRA